MSVNSVKPPFLSTGNKLLWIFLFAAAMAYLEAAVVVYLRLIFYPGGFDFPLVTGPTSIILIELGREAATIIMLVAIGFFCGRSKIERFAYLIISFGLWDILYYVWLKVQIGWPPSLFTWDILFLIPLPWVGPCIAPILVSIALIAGGLWVIKQEESGSNTVFPAWVWWAEIFAGLIIIASFIWDFKNIIAGGIPHRFRWEIFAIGYCGGIALFVWMVVRNRNLAHRSGG